MLKFLFKLLNFLDKLLKILKKIFLIAVLTYVVYIWLFAPYNFFVFALDELDDELLDQIPKSQLPPLAEPFYYVPDLKTHLDSKPLKDHTISIVSLEFEFSNDGVSVITDHFLNTNKQQIYLSNTEYSNKLKRLDMICRSYSAGQIDYQTFFNEVYKSPLVNKTIFDPRSHETIFEKLFNYEKNVFSFKDLSNGLMNFHHNNTTFTKQINFNYNPLFEIMQVELWNLFSYGQSWQYFHDEINKLFDSREIKKSPGQIFYELTSLLMFCKYDQNFLLTIFYILVPDFLFSKPIPFRESALNLIHLKTLQLLVHPETQFVVKEFIVNELYTTLHPFLQEVLTFMSSEVGNWEVTDDEGQLLLDFLINRSYLNHLNLPEKIVFLDDYKHLRYRYHWYTSSWMYWLDSINLNFSNFQKFINALEANGITERSTTVGEIYTALKQGTEINSTVVIVHPEEISFSEELVQELIYDSFCENFLEFEQKHKKIASFLKKYKITVLGDKTLLFLIYWYKYILFFGSCYYFYNNLSFLFEFLKTTEYVGQNIFKDWPPDSNTWW